MKSAIVLLLGLVCAASAMDFKWADGTRHLRQMKSAWAWPGFDANDPMALLREIIAQHQDVMRKPGAGGSNSSASDDPDRMGACWKDNIDREPHAPNYCPPGQEHFTGYCYDECKPGYTASGPLDQTPFCWENCKVGYEDTLGGLCSHDMITVSADNSACPIWDKCGLISNQGCAKCPPAPPGLPPFRHDGCQCRIYPDYYTKDTYIREAHWPTCEPNETFESGFCLDVCPKKYEPKGPVCWQECPKSRPYDAGALCCKDEAACNEFIKNMSKASIQLVAALVEAGFDLIETDELIQQMIQTASSFAFFKCTRYTVGR